MTAEAAANTAELLDQPSSGEQLRQTMIEAWASMKSFRPKDEKQDDRETFEMA